MPRSLRIASVVLAFILCGVRLAGQSGAVGGEWRTYGGDLADTRYAPLDQINKANFNTLQVAWRFKSDALGPSPEYNWESTPLVVNGVLYVTAGTRRAVVALDAATGEMLWMHQEHEGPRGESVSEPAACIRSTGCIARRSHRLHAGTEGRRPATRIALQDRSALHGAGGGEMARPARHAAAPSVTSGANWQGGSFDPETGILYIFSVTSISGLGLVASDGKRSDMSYIAGVASDPAKPAPVGRGANGEGGQTPTIQGLPLVRPPYGRITAVDMNKGEIVWQVAHGDTPDSVRNHPALKGLTIPRTGRPGRIGTLVTKTLIIAGEGGFFTLADGRRGAMLRAYEKATGADAGAIYMPAPQTGSPMTYMFGGKQYIVLAISGGSYSGELVAYKLP